MKKSLIALAVAAAVIAPSADATTTLYGKVRQSLSRVEGDAFGLGKDNAVRIHDQSSRFGIKGSEDLGNGLSAIYQFEFGVGLNNDETKVTPPDSGGAWNLSNRNQFVGLKGGFGTFLVGRHDTPAKMVLGKVGYFFGAQHEADDAIGIGFNSAIRANNALAYVSPNMGGFTFIAATVAGEQDDGTTGNADGIAEAVSVGLKYSNGPFYAGLGYTKVSQELSTTAATYKIDSTGTIVLDDDALTPSDDTEILGLALMYSPGPWQIGYMYEDTDTGSSGLEYKSHLLVGGYKFGNNHVKLKYGIGEESITGYKDRDVDVWGLWLEHNFSKRTKIFAAYSAKNKDDFVLETTAGNVVLDKYEDSSIFSLGLEHNF